ncbi:MAG: hypothetical protein UX68_C0002G0026 [Parcubacteria group bacterium GW2011_GWA2_46_9]|nr:MAG: hypothetical protein UX68_C0002G0026 [Parcubacteria group bacterium GW2011_GWA2_46_9]
MKKYYNQQDAQETAPGRWRRREQKSKPKMRVHGRGTKDLAKRLSDKNSTNIH